MTDGPAFQSVIVTGAASGIGKACVEYLLTKNNNVLAVDLDLDRLKTAFPKPSSNLNFCAADISKSETFTNIAEQTTSRFGKIDALIHWAAIHSTKTSDVIKFTLIASCKNQQ